MFRIEVINVSSVQIIAIVVGIFILLFFLFIMFSAIIMSGQTDNYIENERQTNDRKEDVKNG